MAWKRTFISAFIAQVLGIIGLSFATPFLPLYVAELGIDDPGQQAFWAGVALSAAGLTFAVFAPIWGTVADRFGRKPMVFRAMLGGTVVMVLMSFARNVPELILYRLLQGAFSGSLAASISLVASVVPHRHSGLTLGMMQSAVFIGHAVGPFFGGMAADALGYRVCFRIGAGLTLLGGVLVLAGTREEFTPRDAQASRDGPGFRAIFLLPGFLISVVIMFAVRLSNSIANPSFPLIVREFPLSPQHFNSITGSIMGVTALAAAASSAILGHIGDKIGRRSILVACCVGACVASVGHYMAQTLFTLFAARILFGFSVAGMLPSATAMIYSIIDPRSIGKAYGLATSLSMLGAAAGPTLGGVLAMSVGLRFPFLVTAAAQLMLAVLVLAYVRDKNRFT